MKKAVFRKIQCKSLGPSSFGKKTLTHARDIRIAIVDNAVSAICFLARKRMPRPAFLIGD